MAEALREGRKRRIAWSDINATETATFLVAAWAENSKKGFDLTVEVQQDCGPGVYGAGRGSL
jgi:hypothetical protein